MMSLVILCPLIVRVSQKRSLKDDRGEVQSSLSSLDEICIIVDGAYGVRVICIH